MEPHYNTVLGSTGNQCYDRIVLHSGSYTQYVYIFILFFLFFIFFPRTITLYYLTSNNSCAIMFRMGYQGSSMSLSIVGHPCAD